jgi:D-alanyl-D-alanine carboxypeptidase/D-alanyl-D-alanine-endopeptidase (penicillin-binding protein 4)
VNVVNKPSHNFFADQILRTLGLQRRGVGSFAAGVEEVVAWLEEIGVPQTEAIQMFDGSGLARDNLIQPRQMCHLLRHMARPGRGHAAFVDSLPVAGVDGNLAERMKQPPTRGNVRAKTGYISNARTLSGYVTHAAGEDLVFTMMCNQYTVPTREATAFQNRACTVLASWAP